MTPKAVKDEGKHTPGPIQALDEALDWLLLADKGTDGRERGDALKKHMGLFKRLVEAHMLQKDKS